MQLCASRSDGTLIGGCDARYRGAAQTTRLTSPTRVVVFRIPAIYRARLMDAGIDFAKRHGTIPEFLPIPAAFVIDRDGRVAWRFANVDFTRRADPGRILTALRRLVTPDPE